MSEARRAYDQKRYWANIEKSRAHGRAQYRKYKLARLHSQVQRRFMIQSIKSQPCMDCKKTYSVVCMDFDHVRGEKKFDLSHSLSYPIETILKEIEKCDIVCANCHRIRTEARKDVRIFA